MPAATFNFTKTGTRNAACEQGATFSFSLTWKDSGGSAVNLTGYTARMKIKKDVEDTSAVLTLTTENGGITLGGALGTIALLATATQTGALDAGNYVYDLEMVLSSTVTRLIEGNFQVTPQVTT